MIRKLSRVVLIVGVLGGLSLQADRTWATRNNLVVPPVSSGTARQYRKSTYRIVPKNERTNVVYYPDAYVYHQTGQRVPPHIAQEAQKLFTNTYVRTIGVIPAKLVGPDGKVQNAYKVTSLPQDSGIFLDQAGRPLQLGRLQSQSGFKTLLKSVRSGKAKKIITAVKAALKPFDPSKVKIELLDTLYNSSALVSGNPAP